jgi:hypothetical protein
VSIDKIDILGHQGFPRMKLKVSFNLYLVGTVASSAYYVQRCRCCRCKFRSRKIGSCIICKIRRIFSELGTNIIYWLRMACRDTIDSYMATYAHMYVCIGSNADCRHTHVCRFLMCRRLSNLFFYYFKALDMRSWLWRDINTSIYVHQLIRYFI